MASANTESVATNRTSAVGIRGLIKMRNVTTPNAIGGQIGKAPTIIDQNTTRIKSTTTTRTAAQTRQVTIRPAFRSVTGALARNAPHDPHAVLATLARDTGWDRQADPTAAPSPRPDPIPSDRSGRPSNAHSP